MMKHEHESRYTRRTLLKLTAGTVAVFSLPRRSHGRNGVSIGMIVPSPIDDLGFSQAAKESMDKVKTELGIDVEIVDKVGFGDVTTILTDLALRHNVLIAESNGYLEGTLEAASQLPDKHFMVRNTQEPGNLPSNVMAYDTNFGSMGYVQGVIAGHLTQTDKIGDIDSLPILIRFANIRGLICGTRSVNSKAQVLKGFIGSFYDPPKSRALAESLVAQGCDVLITGVNSPTAGVVAAARGLWAIGGIGNQNPAAPDGFATSVTSDISPVILRGLNAIQENRWEAFRQSGGAPNQIIAPQDGIPGVIGLTPFNPRVSKEVQNAARETLALVNTNKVAIPRIWDKDVCPDGHHIDVSE